MGNKICVTSLENSQLCEHDDVKRKRCVYLKMLVNCWHTLRNAKGIQMLRARIDSTGSHSLHLLCLCVWLGVIRWIFFSFVSHVCVCFVVLCCYCYCSDASAILRVSCAVLYITPVPMRYIYLRRLYIMCYRMCVWVFFVSSTIISLIHSFHFGWLVVVFLPYRRPWVKCYVILLRPCRKYLFEQLALFSTVFEHTAQHTQQNTELVSRSQYRIDL